MKGQELSIESLKQIVREAYQQLKTENPRGDISGQDVAKRAYRTIDPKAIAPPLVRFAACEKLADLHSELHKIHRAPVEEENQLPLFEGLEKRYSVKRGGHLVSVLRSNLTFEERQTISRLLWQSADAYQKHAKAFDEETATLLATGKLRTA